MSLSKRLKKLSDGQPKTDWRRRPEVLLSGNIPKPMHRLTPRTILGRKWWDATRKAAYASTDYHCVACGVHKCAAKYRQWLEGHELYETDFLLGRLTYIETVPVCHLCHNYIHDGRLKALLEQAKISQAKYTAVVQHGDQVLKEAGLVRRLYQGPIADWGDWRLVLNGQEYPPLYADYDEWVKAHAS